MIYAKVLYDNALRKGTLAYSGTITPGFEPVNAVDWRDFSALRLATGNSNLDCPNPAGQQIDTAVIWVRRAVGTALTQINVQYESSPGVFTTVASLIGPATGMYFLSFAPVTVVSGRIVRVRFLGVTGEVDIRQVTVGQALEFAIGQWTGIAIPSLTHGIVNENVIAINGSIIGRNVRRVEKEANIELQYLPDSWVRNSWEPFARHAKRYPFWYQWDPTGHPTDLAFASAKSIEPPKNDRPPPYLAVSMPLQLITD